MMLADRAGLSVGAVASLELNRHEPHDETQDRVRKAFEAAGIVFWQADWAEGVIVVRGK